LDGRRKSRCALLALTGQQPEVTSDRNHERRLECVAFVVAIARHLSAARSAARTCS